MSTTDRGADRNYETWSAIAFLLAGVLWLLDAVSLIVNQFLAPTPVTTALVGVAFVAGILLSVLGVVGLYPRLAPETPLLARAAVGAIALVGVGLVALILLSLVLPSLPSFLQVGLFRLLIVALLLSFLLLGWGSVQTTTPSKLVGLLLLGIGMAYAVHFGWNAVQPTSTWRPIVSTGAQTILALGLGYALLSGTRAAESA